VTHGEIVTWVAARDCIHGWSDDECGDVTCAPCRVRESLPDMRCFCGKYVLDRRCPSMYDRGLDEIVQIYHTPERCEPPPARRVCPTCKQTVPEHFVPPARSAQQGKDSE